MFKCFCLLGNKICLWLTPDCISFFSELCPKPNDTRNSLSKKSHVEDFDGVPELFNVLATAEDSESDYWDAFTFQVDWSRGKPTLEKDEKYYLSECLAPSQMVYKYMF